MKPKEHIDIDACVWAEAGGEILREKIRHEAHVLHQFHQAPETLEAWKKKKGEIRKKIVSLADRYPDDSGLDVRWYSKIKMKGYTIFKLSYRSRKNLRVTANLFVPDRKGCFPAILNVHGHCHQGKIAERVAARGHVFAMEGFVVLSVDAIGAGERGTLPGEFEHHGTGGLPLFAVGESLMGAQIIDNMRGIDFLQSLDYVDASRIGVTGASGGGNQTMWISALDPRVKAAVPVVSVGTFEAYVGRGNCWCETIFDGLKITEEWGILGMIAPNPLLILTANQEKLHAFLPEEMLRTYKETRKIYRLYEAEEKIAYRIIDLPHAYFPEMLQASLGWFKYWLQGEGSALPRQIPEHEILPESELLCFKGRKRPAEIKSLIEYASIRTQEKKKEFSALKKLNCKEKKRDLLKMQRVPKGPDYCKLGEIVKNEESGVKTWKLTIESEHGVLLPCALIFPEGKYSSIVVTVSQEGKKELAGNNDVLALLKQNKAICLADLRNTGESRWNHVDDIEENYSARAAAWLGRTSIGDWVKDLHAIHAAIKKLLPGISIEAMGFNEMAVAVLSANVLNNDFSKIYAVNLIASYVQNGKVPKQRSTIWIPGILCWGDISLMAALSDAALKIKTIIKMSGKKLTAGEFSLWRKEVNEMSFKLGKKGKVIESWKIGERI